MEQRTDFGSKFQCHICRKYLSTKQRLFTHINSKHGEIRDAFAPYQIRKYKKYEEDPSIPIPKSTHRWRNSKLRISELCMTDAADYTSKQPDHQDEHNQTDDLPVCELEQTGISNVALISASNEISSQKTEVTWNVTVQDIVTHDSVQSDYLKLDSAPIQNTGSQVEETSETDILSDGAGFVDSLSNSSDSDSEWSSTSSDDCGDIELSSDSDCEDANQNQDHAADAPGQKGHGLALLAYIMKYKLSGQASIDLLKFLGHLNSDFKSVSINDIKQLVGSGRPEIIDFCCKCNTIFPDAEEVFRCSQEGCMGLRYKGTVDKQSLRQRKSFFACLSLEHQLKDILQRDGIYTAIRQYRKSCNNSPVIKDILTGQLIRDLQKPGNFLSYETNISLLFNTDGVPLYKSSSVSVWPVYLVINDLPPAMRFSKKTMLLWGIWQAPGKPVFETFFNPFIKQMELLRIQGFEVLLDNETIRVKALLIAGTMDLQAKSYVTCMTQHNGKYGCLSCEEPGLVVNQGKGHCRIYPYRNDPAPLRTSHGFCTNAIEAENTAKTVMGIKGISALLGLPSFDIINGIVPDYMHGVLLGITKKMLQLQMLSSYSKEPFFLGNHIKKIDKRLTSMCPTDQVSRLPRKLETNIHHLKASELQMWLLFYSLPCLVGVMEDKYLDHWALLVEAIYILLDNVITMEKLARAENLLQLYYKNIEELYGINHYTLNVHNTCQHLCAYVKHLGPLWAWSCFPFEDMNGTVIDSVHGTGDVCMQMLWTVQAQKRINVDVAQMEDPFLKEFAESMISTNRPVKISVAAVNCKIAGALVPMKVPEQLQDDLLKLLDTSENKGIGKISKALRVIIGNEVFFSKQYHRMKKRTVHIVLLKEGSDSDIVCIEYFIYHHDSNTCLAVAKEVTLKEDQPLLHAGVHHILQISNQEGKYLVVKVEQIKEKMLFLGGNKGNLCVAKLPTFYGQFS